MVRPAQIWDRREKPERAVEILECGAGKVTYQTHGGGTVVTVSKVVFKRLYKRRQLPRPTKPRVIRKR